MSQRTSVPYASGFAIEPEALYVQKGAKTLNGNITGKLNKPLHPEAVYATIVKHYAEVAGISVPGFCVHSLRATAATNALDHQADIARVQEWLGHSSTAHTRAYIDAEDYREKANGVVAALDI